MTAIVAALLLLLLPCASGARVVASTPLPSPGQLWYQHAEIHALIHFNMATFARDGDPGCQPDNWNNKTAYAAGLTSDPATFAPAKLNTSQWGDVMEALGAKGAILTAKHGCGHLLWKTNTTLPDGSAYGYNVGSEKAFIKEDVLHLFQASMTERGIRHGFYYSLTNNFYLNVGGHQAHKLKQALPGQVDVSQDQFESIALSHVTELWTKFGTLGEIWFDGTLPCTGPAGSCCVVRVCVIACVCLSFVPYCRYRLTTVDSPTPFFRRFLGLRTQLLVGLNSCVAARYGPCAWFLDPKSAIFDRG